MVVFKKKYTEIEMKLWDVNNKDVSNKKRKYVWSAGPRKSKSGGVSDEKQQSSAYWMITSFIHPMKHKDTNQVETDLIQIQY